MRFQLDPADLQLASLRDFLAMGAYPVYDTADALVLRFGEILYGAGNCDECNEFRESLMCLCVDGSAADRLVEAGCFDDVTPVLQYVYRGQMPEELHYDFDLRPLSEEHIPFLVAHYDHPSSTVKHMGERVRSGSMLGAFLQDRCIGFAGLHEEGAVGMLAVLPEYRRLGVASALVRQLVRRLMLLGRIPYAHIYPANTVSIAFHEKLGFVRAEQPVIWLCKHDAYTGSRLN